jgi:protein-S-isoprenylcysteine O-methyltransferase Ste14
MSHLQEGITCSWHLPNHFPTLLTIFFVAMAFALDSYWALIPADLTIIGMVWRLSDEETLFSQDLPCYKEYRAKVRWRLIPRIFWISSKTHIDV